MWLRASHTLELPLKSSNEIDVIFASKKRKKRDPEKTNQSNKDATVKPNKQTKNKKKKDKVFKDNDVPGRKKNNKVFKDYDVPVSQISKPRRKKMNDGLTVYTEEELGINKSDAGGTPLCPFDCECCF